MGEEIANGGNGRKMENERLLEMEKRMGIVGDGKWSKKWEMEEIVGYGLTTVTLMYLFSTSLH